MKVHVYEKAWIGVSLVLLVAFVAAVVITSLAMGVHPPSHMETIDPKAVGRDPRFASPGVRTGADGSIEAVVVAMMWSFNPGEIRVPAGRRVKFRLTSPDVIHGFEVVGTNVNAMVIPGYVSEVVTRFDRPGEYLMVCHEYCGVGHHMMSGKLIVTGQSTAEGSRS